MKLIEIVFNQFKDRSGVVTLQPGESALPPTPKIVAEFTHGEWLELSRYLFRSGAYKEIDANLVGDILDICHDAGLDFAEPKNEQESN